MKMDRPLDVPSESDLIRTYGESVTERDMARDLRAAFAKVVRDELHGDLVGASLVMAEFRKRLGKRPLMAKTIETVNAMKGNVAALASKLKKKEK